MLVGQDGDLVLQALTLRRWDVSVLRAAEGTPGLGELVSALGAPAS